MLNTKPHKKLIPLYILKILREYTDLNHHIRQQKIVCLLKKDFSIECERKAVARNISYLIDAGFDICNDKGYYLAERPFDDCELRLIIDILLFSNYIPKKQCNELIQKVSTLSSRYFKSKLNYISSIKSFRPQNKQLFYTIEILDQAISEKRQVEFTYNSYGTDKKLHSIKEEPYIVYPYQMAINNGFFYLICNYNKYDRLSHFRIDRITNIKIANKCYKNSSEFTYLDLQTYMAEHIYMCSGNSTTVTFRVVKSMIGDVLDWFCDCEFIKENSKYCYVKVNVNINAMVYWSLQYGAYVEVLEPLSIREKIKDLSQVIANKYKDSNIIGVSKKSKVAESYKNAYVKMTI